MKAAAPPTPDFETVNLLFHPEHEYVSLTSAVEGESFRGARGFREFLDSSRGAVEWVPGNLESARELDRHRVLLELTVTVRGTSSDVELSARRAYVVTVREGKAVRTESYASPEAALEAVGLSE